MHSRAQAWYSRRTWHWRDWPAELLLERKRCAEARISVVIPARDEERTVPFGGQVAHQVVEAPALLAE